MSKTIHIVGSGLAGSEAAFYLAEKGHKIHLHEMRPGKMTEAHKTEQSAELVCSNSLKSKAPQSAPGMMKAEMTKLGSLILKAAEVSQVPGGEALAVDRDVFAGEITRVLRAHKKYYFRTWRSHRTFFGWHHSFRDGTVDIRRFESVVSSRDWRA